MSFFGNLALICSVIWLVKPPILALHTPNPQEEQKERSYKALEPILAPISKSIVPKK